jgi:hypothetical protein
MASAIRFSSKNIKIDKSIFSKEDYNYIDPDMLSETHYRFEFPTNKPDENGDIMSNDMYIALANILKLQYLLPVKYFKVNEQTFSYVAQKSNIIGENKGIENAAVQIEPLNGNFCKQVRYVHINQAIPVGTTFYIHTEIPYRAEGESTPVARKLLTSASIKTEETDLDKKILEEAKKMGIDKPSTALFNRRIAFGALDIGSRLDMKMEVDYTDIHESLTLFRFHAPDVNILEFIVYDHWNVDIKYILRLMKEDKRLDISEHERKFLNDLLDKMIAVAK